ncbi:RHS repeat-associated core domain-containing protein, partial [Roseofilum sp. Belize Diploria]|uniref:RHS repeat-associated core domain-containing protein n=1 Tax=Roseofilum sp. Belize Diploria TaxID=2821501 RepID=UPI001B1803F6
AVELVYDTDSQLQTVEDLYGQPTYYVYDKNGNVLTEINSVGRKIVRTYDERNNVLTQTVVTEESGEQGWKTTYTYDSRNNKLSETDPLDNTTYYTYNSQNQILTVTNSLGHTTSFSYDDRGNLVSVTNAEGDTIDFTYDGSGNLTSIIKAEDNITQFKYDEFGNRILEIDALGNETAYTYDASGNATTKTTTLTSSITGIERTLTATKTYDTQGNLISVLDAENGLTQLEYDANNNVVALTDAQNNLIQYEYSQKNTWNKTVFADDTPEDLQDNPTIAFESTINPDGKVEQIIDPLGNITYSKYNHLDRSVELILPDDTPEDLSDNPQKIARYDTAGRLISQTDERGRRIEYEYDDAGRRTVVRQVYQDQSIETKTIYNQAGWVIATIDPLGHKTEFRHNKLGQVTETIFHDGTSIKVDYDKFGNLIAYTDREGRTTEYEYDVLDRLTAIVDHQKQRTEYKYDEAGNIVEQLNANGERTQYEYDGLGQRTAVVRAMGQESRSKYDELGNPIETTDFNGNTILYTYDEQGRLVSKTLSGETEPFIQYGYNAMGRLESVEDDRGLTTYTYEDRGLLASRTDPDGSTISYTYNEIGQIETLTTPAGSIVYQYDELNRLKQVTEGTETTAYEYNAVGNLEKTTYPNGVVETRDYDTLHRLTNITTKDESGTVISSYDYTLDNAGNRTAVEELGGRKVEWTYDELNRLTDETITDPVDGDRTIKYVYDKVGNRLSREVTSAQEVVLTTYTYDKNDRLKSEQTNGVTTKYTYDDNGNLLLANVQGSPEQIEYIWDAENRLIGVNKTNAAGATESIEYQYNARGIRVSSTLNGVTTNYLIDENRQYAQVLEEYTLDGANRQTEATYTYGLNLVSQERGGDQLFYLHDNHSGVRQLTDEGGTVTDTYHYDAYGNLLSIAGSSENNYLYRGEQYDSFAQMQYLRARYYDPHLGRFASVDPFEGWLYQPMSLHRYLYGNANPVTFSDPSGEVAVNMGLHSALMSILSSMSYAVPTGALSSALLGITKAVLAIQLSAAGVTLAHVAAGLATYYYRKNNGGKIWEGTLALETGLAGVESNVDTGDMSLPGNFGFLFAGNGNFTNQSYVDSEGNNPIEMNVDVSGIGGGVREFLKYTRYQNIAPATYDVKLATLEDDNPNAFTGLFVASNFLWAWPGQLQQPSNWDFIDVGYIGMGGGISGFGAVGIMKGTTPDTATTIDTFDSIWLVGWSLAQLNQLSSG